MIRSTCYFVRSAPSNCAGAGLLYFLGEALRTLTALPAAKRQPPATWLWSEWGIG